MAVGGRSRGELDRGAGGGAVGEKEGETSLRLIQYGSTWHVMNWYERGMESFEYHTI